MQTEPNSGEVAAFEVLRGVELWEPDPGDEVQVRFAGTFGTTHWYHVRYMGAALAAVYLIPLEPEIPQGLVAEIRPVVAS